MTKRLYLLNGIAILAVVCNHAGGWGNTALFWWTDRYRAVAVPNFDQIGSLSYYGLLCLRQLALFSVPAFLFVSGYFVSYSARGGPALRWKMVRVRITRLLVPYLIWSAAIFASEFFGGIQYSPGEYLKRLALGGATPAYFYVPALCQLYLLSPLIIPLARTRWRPLLLASALLHLSMIGLQYAGSLWEPLAPALAALRFLASPWLFPKWAFFFALGLVCGLHLEQFKRWIVKHRWGLLAAVALLGPASIVESELIHRWTGNGLGGNPGVLTSSLYTVAFVLCFLAFHQVSVPFSGLISQLSKRSYGIYLLHPKALEFIARLVRYFAPWMLAYQVLFQPVLVAVAVGGLMLLMSIVAKSPGRRVYRHLFG